MTVDAHIIETLAPDQASLKAAQKLLKPGKWSIKQSHAQFIWAHCQGSGANPYLTVFDMDNHGYKCTCPSRKFPCKHVLALAWMYAEQGKDAFPDAEIPTWVSDWQGRRRNTATTVEEDTPAKKKGKVSIQAAQQAEPVIDSVAEEKKQAANAKRALKAKQATEQAVRQGLLEYEQWLNDQLRTGLAGFIDDALNRCRKISARLVDAKATTLAGRMDELPAKLLAADKDMRLRITINELGKIQWLIKAWRENPDHPDARRAVQLAETRDKLLEEAQAPKIHGIWQIAAEHIEARRDGLISHATWLRLVAEIDKGNDGGATRFALLQDYYPASAGRRQITGRVGSYLVADMLYYPSDYPLRAIIVQQEALNEAPPAFVDSGKASMQDFFRAYQQALVNVPWLEAMPYQLPAGRFIACRPSVQTKKKSSAFAHVWWQSSADHRWQLPLSAGNKPEAHEWQVLLGSQVKHSMILWDGVYAKYGSSATAWGVI